MYDHQLGARKQKVPPARPQPPSRTARVVFAPFEGNPGVLSVTEKTAAGETVVDSIISAVPGHSPGHGLQARATWCG
jgi:hypothetical protein